jgi:hypothetical protein
MSKTAVTFTIICVIYKIYSTFKIEYAAKHECGSKLTWTSCFYKKKYTFQNCQTLTPFQDILSLH